MPTIYSMFGWNFDDNINFDSSRMFDESNSAIININTEIELDPASFLYTAVDLEREITITTTLEWEDTLVDYVDLLPLVPEKFHDSDMMVDLLDILGVFVGTWTGEINELTYLINPRTVPIKYSDFLAGLINLNIITGTDISDTDIRQQIQEAVEWYKIKGTYESLILLSYLNNFNVQLWDMYTNDYSTFVRQEWFVDNQYNGYNPSGLTNDYYKSPHFGYEIILDKLYYAGSFEYLWKDEQFENIDVIIEETRPANTVPHISALLECVTIEDFQLYITTYNAATIVTGNWEYQKRYFDEENDYYICDSLDNNVIDNSSNSVIVNLPYWRFDSGKYFDESKTGFLTNITKFKIGTGNKGIYPDVSSFALETVVKTGDIHNIEIFDDRVEFEILIEEMETYSGLSELALYNDSLTQMVVASTFPDVDKTLGMELRIIVKIYIKSFD